MDSQFKDLMDKVSLSIYSSNDLNLAKMLGDSITKHTNDMKHLSGLANVYANDFANMTKYCGGGIALGELSSINYMQKDLALSLGNFCQIAVDQINNSFYKLSSNVLKGISTPLLDINKYTIGMNWNPIVYSLPSSVFNTKYLVHSIIDKSVLNWDEFSWLHGKAVEATSMVKVEKLAADSVLFMDSLYSVVAELSDDNDTLDIEDESKAQNIFLRGIGLFFGNVSVNWKTFVDEIKSYKNKWLATAVFWVFNNFFRLVFTVIMSYHASQLIEAYGNDRNKAEKEVQKYVTQQINDDEYFESHRLVTSDMIVYVSDAKDSGFMGKVKRGCIVVILEKRKNWTKIEYMDTDTDRCLQGWVFTRYLLGLKYI